MAGTPEDPECFEEGVGQGKTLTLHLREVEFHSITMCLGKVLSSLRTSVSPSASDQHPFPISHAYTAMAPWSFFM